MEPYATDDVRYAVVDWPFATVWPLKVHATAPATTQVGLVYVPESVPLLQTRDCDVQVEPNGTDGNCHAVTDWPLATAEPFQVHELSADTATVAESLADLPCESLAV